MLSQQEIQDLHDLLPDGDVDMKSKLLKVNSLFNAGIMTGSQVDTFIEDVRTRLASIYMPEPVVYNRTTITDAQILALEAEYKVEIEFNPTTKKYDVFKNAEKVNVGDKSNPVYKIIGTHVIEFEANLDLEKELIPYLNNI